MMKKIIVFLLSLTLVLSLTLSLSSCLGKLSSVLRPYLNGANGQEAEEEQEEEESSQPDSPSQEGENTPSSGEEGGDEEGGNSSVGEGNEDQSSSEYYPELDEISVSGQRKALLSAVSIVSNFDVSSYTEGKTSVGSGVIYRLDKEQGDAYIITNFHVVYNRNAYSTNGISNDISLYLYGMELNSYKIPATYVGGSLTQDIAVLKVEGSEVIKNSAARAADIGNSDALAVFDSVFAVGNAEGMGLSVTKGIVSVESEQLSMVGADSYTALNLRVIRVDAAINQGNSGGGLFDKDGNLVGIVNAKREGSAIDNIGYAIPISYANNLADSIIYYCNDSQLTNPYKSLMGVTVTAKVLGLEIDETTGKMYRVEIVEIAELTDTSIAKDKLFVGDRILSISIDGAKKEVKRTHNIIDHMLTARLGSTITLEITRSGEPLTVSLTVTEDSMTLIK